ncbi:hypothetical protein [Flavisolibacter nicotianae]|uniref:hypothetical protein n=1 Tax=Flavisolibacter nicotianae TaxID=2364882 RepID=UPI000EADF2B6|nr:hypothetical protein [Flavisolibacter nicotianae]
MQKFLHFEITMAVKDRPKTFQVITLMLLAFSITVILVNSVSRLSSLDVAGKQTLGQAPVTPYAGFVTSPAHHLVTLKK